MAVLAAYRGRGVGSAILLHLMDAARQARVASVTLSAQTHAIPFYERHGFVAHGEIYLDAGIEHRTMDRPL
jgi:predicted GNAT family N-acyltransferase